MTNADKTAVKNLLKAYRIEEDKRNEAKFVEDEAGKSLVSDTEITRLAGMETGAQVNVIESVSIKGGAAGTIDTDTKTITLNLDDYAKKSDVVSASAEVYTYKGTKDTFAELPATGNKTGDVWNIRIAGGTDRYGVDVKAGDNVAYVIAGEDDTLASGWDVMGGTTDLSGYLDKATYKDVLDDIIAGSTDTFVASDIDFIFADDDEDEG